MYFKYNTTVFCTVYCNCPLTITLKTYLRDSTDFAFEFGQICGTTKRITYAGLASVKIRVIDSTIILYFQNYESGSAQQTTSTEYAFVSVGMQVKEKKIGALVDWRVGGGAHVERVERVVVEAHLVLRRLLARLKDLSSLLRHIWLRSEFEQPAAHLKTRLEAFEFEEQIKCSAQREQRVHRLQLRVRKVARHLRQSTHVTYYSE